MTKFNLNILWLYPDLMNTYGDRGNIFVLKKRGEWRGIKIKVISHTIGSGIEDIKKSDLIFMGGAQDRQQKLVGSDLSKKADYLRESIETGIPGLYICGAYQFLGNYYKPATGAEIRGLGIFDLYTKHFGIDKPRAIGNVAVSWHNQTLVGFENHGGRTYLGNNIKPFAEVIKGDGNNGEDKTEGAIYKNSIGSYLHGPILPKNPSLADYLIETALKKKYKESMQITSLDDSLEKKARDHMLKLLDI